MTGTKRKLLIISREPAPYKADLYNALAEVGGWDVLVFYCALRDWSPEGGHDFHDLPACAFQSRISDGRTLFSKLHGALSLVAVCIQYKPALTIICGYQGISYCVALLFCMALRIPYAFWVDVFNNQPPRFGGHIGAAVRTILRRIIFRTAKLVLVCGQPGSVSALAAGCPREKLVDFPYAVNVERLERSMPQHVPEACQRDLGSGQTIILFSGRLIPRKGLSTLMRALSTLPRELPWILWVEGEGPKRGEYEALSRRLDMEDSCRFLGFCQMELHAWLVLHAEIVVVPSLSDPWGIVVDEAMQLGKAVCASDATGSALDRIADGENGVLFKAGDEEDLRKKLAALLCSKRMRRRLATAARNTASVWGPARNVKALSHAIT